MENIPKFKKSSSRRNKSILIIDEIYIYNFICKNKKENTDKFRCKEYKTKFHCRAYINLKKYKTKNLIINILILQTN